MLEELFHKAFTKEFPTNFEQKIFVQERKLKKEPKDQIPEEEEEELEYVPRGQNQAILLNETIPIFPPYIKWQSPPKKEEEKKIDPYLMNLVEKNLIEKEQFLKYLYQIYPVLGEDTIENEKEQNEKKVKKKSKSGDSLFDSKKRKVDKDFSE